MTVDLFAERVALVRQRFVATLEAKIEDTCAALPLFAGGESQAVAAVAEAYRCMHGVVGIGRTVGFSIIGEAARDVENILRPAYHAGRGLAADEVSLLKASLQALRKIATREVQSAKAISH